MNTQPLTRLTNITCSKQILVDVRMRTDSINSQYNYWYCKQETKYNTNNLQKWRLSLCVCLDWSSITYVKFGKLGQSDDCSCVYPFRPL